VALEKFSGPTKMFGEIGNFQERSSGRCDQTWIMGPAEAFSKATTLR